MRICYHYAMIRRGNSNIRRCWLMDFSSVQMLLKASTVTSFRIDRNCPARGGNLKAPTICRRFVPYAPIVNRDLAGID